MSTPAEPGRRVRLRTLVLAQLLRERGWSAQQLHMMAGQPSKRAINRWLQRGKGAPGGLVISQFAYVDGIATALGVPVFALIDGGARDADAEGHERDHYLLVAAARGPRVYPDLMDDLGVAETGASLDPSDGTLVPTEDDDPRTLRFARWSYCEDLLGEGAWIPNAFARRATAWASRVGLDVKEAPELHCLCALALEDSDGALVAGLEWMRQATRRGVLAEAIWVGDRVLRDVVADDDEVPGFDAFVEMSLLQARALRLSGSTQRALELLTELALSRARVRSRVLEARVMIELARVRDFCGLRRAALEASQEAVARLRGSDDDDAREHLVQALMDTVYFADGLEDAGTAREAIEALGSAMRRPSSGTIARYYRLMGISALDRGSVRVALDQFLHAVDVAEADGDQREAGVGRLNIALAYALVGEARRARGYFEKSVAYVASGGPGPLAAAIVHQNFGEYLLEQGELVAAARHLEIAIGQYEEAGRYPSYTARCRALLAEVHIGRGDLALARRVAKKAYQSSLVAESALDEALALSVFARAHVDTPETAVSWVRVAEDRLATLEADTMVIPRFGVERRCAETRFLAGASDSPRRDLERLARRAGALELGTERRRIEQLLAGDAGRRSSN